jgi:hypothetical protein
MTIDQQRDIFNQRVCAFIERHAQRSYEGRDFEYELRGIIMSAMELAQAPYIHEYHKLQDLAATASMLRPTL